MRSLKFALYLAFSLVLFSGPVWASSFEVLEDIPVQHNGRIKPFETFAREASLYITGKTSFDGVKATELLWRWMVEPDAWIDRPMIPVSGKELQKEFKVMMVNRRLSAELILNHQPFLEAARAAFLKQEKKEKLTTHETKQLELYDKAILLRQIGQGALPGWVAHPKDNSARWFSFQDIVSPARGEEYKTLYNEEVRNRFQKAVENLVNAVREAQGKEAIEKAAREFEESLTVIHRSENVSMDQEALTLEITYNHLRPFAWAWKAYLLSVLFFIIAVIFRGLSAGFAKPFTLVGILIFTLGFLLHTYGFYLRCMIAGRPPVSNMYESIVWVSWAIVLFSFILSIMYRTQTILIFSGAVATFALVIAQGFPALFDPFISPLVPVLRSNLWLTVHVLTITLSYGAFALAWAIGHGALYQFAFKPEKKELHKKYTLYLYRAVQIGVVLLAAGTVLGGVWANYSWGRFWGWDPKETWALIALLGYIFVLHGRFAGWLGPFGFSAGVIVAFLGVIIAWYGVNYVLAAGLHSYGFGGGGAKYVAWAVLFDFLLVAALAWRYKKVRS